MGCAASTAIEPGPSTPLKARLRQPSQQRFEAPKEKKSLGWLHSLFEGSSGAFVQPSFGCTVSGA